MGMRGPGARPLIKLRPGWVRTGAGDYERVIDQTTKNKPKGSARVSRKSHAVFPWLEPGLTRSDRVIVFCESFKITSGPDIGKMFKLREWQRAFIRDVYREDDKGQRPVRTAILSMGRKNGKTALAALMALCHLCGPEAEPRGECYSVAPTTGRRRPRFSPRPKRASFSIRCCQKRITISQFMKTMKDLITGSTFTALSPKRAPRWGFRRASSSTTSLGRQPEPQALRRDGLRAGCARQPADAGDLDAGRRRLWRPCRC
jgi:hypothetical protein